MNFDANTIIYHSGDHRRRASGGHWRSLRARGRRSCSHGPGNRYRNRHGAAGCRIWPYRTLVRRPDDVRHDTEPDICPDGYSIWPILLTGAVGAMIMMDATMLTGSWIYAYAVGAPFASAKVNYDPITKFSQPPYVAPGTVGQGIPTVCFVSGTIGACHGRPRRCHDLLPALI